MISVSHLVKRYGSHLAVDDVSFDVDKGEVVGFLGPNGAGKSTTLRVLAGFLGMNGGTVKVAGFDVVEDSFEARKRIGYMPEAVPLYPEMRVHEYLTFRAELKGVERKKRRAQVDGAMEKANVEDRATTLIGSLSKGYRQRVGLADALVSDPPLLILDEPTAGLDPNQIREVRDVIKALGKEHTVLLSTHILSEVESTCTRILVIAKGKLVAQGKTPDIRKLRRSPGLEVRLAGDGDAAQKILKGVEGVFKVKATKDGTLTVLRATWSKKTDDAAVEKATETAVRELAGLGIRSVQPVSSSLEEVFAELTRAPDAPKDPDDEETDA